MAQATKKCTKCKEIKDISLFHIACKETRRRRGDCNSCRKIIRKASYDKNRDHYLEKSKEYNNNNKEKRSKYNKEWQVKNKDKTSIYNKRWYSNNLDKVKAKNISRKYTEKQAKVAWANKAKIKQIYKECKTMTEITGTIHHVDHIIPLKGKNVCGLHVENNLQILTKENNLKKSNSFTGGGL